MRVFGAPPDIVEALPIIEVVDEGGHVSGQES